jgi:hypothetical protein
MLFFLVRTRVEIRMLENRSLSWVFSTVFFPLQIMMLHSLLDGPFDAHVNAFLLPKE